MKGEKMKQEIETATTGTCKYCHQIRTIERVSDSFTQEERDEIASHECNRKGAKEAREVDYQIQRAEAAIRQIVSKKDENAAKIFTAGLRAMAEGDIQSIQVKAWDGMKYQMTRKEKKIVVKSVETNEEESSGDETE
jgi:hypothetical protein